MPRDETNLNPGCSVYLPLDCIVRTHHYSLTLLYSCIGITKPCSLSFKVKPSASHLIPRVVHYIVYSY